MNKLHCIAHVTVGHYPILPTVILHQVVGKTAFMHDEMVMFQVRFLLDAERVAFTA